MPKKATTKRVPRRKFTPARKQQIVTAASKTSVAAAAKRFKVSDALIYKWKNQLASAKTVPVPKTAPAPTRKRRKTRTRSNKLVQYAKTNHLETENQQLRNMVVDQLLIIKELQHRA